MSAFSSIPGAGHSGVSLLPSSALAVISSKFFELEIINGEHPRGTIWESRIGDMILLRSTTEAGRVTAARSDRSIRRSKSNDFLLGVAVKGCTCIQQEGREARVSAGEMILIDSQRQYELEILDETEMLWLKLSRKSVEPRIFEHWRYLGQTLRTDHGLGLVAGRMLEASVITASSINVPDGRRFENSFIDILGAAFLGQSNGDIDALPRHISQIFNRAREVIDENLENPSLRPAHIAKALGLSERYVRKLFSAHGVTMMAWIRSQRLRRCHEAIISGASERVSFAEIAYAHGFGDVSSFNRSFKAEFGITPSNARARGRPSNN